MTLHVENAAVDRSGKRILTVETLQLRPGQLTAVVGPNGAGKSTLLSLLTGDVAPDCGRVTLNGRDLSAFSLSELAERRAAIGAPPDLAFGFTVADVIGMGWLHGRTPHHPAFQHALHSVLEATELEALAERTYMTLSSGERQRVQYARASLQLWPVRDIQGPRWLFLDEPTANMDVAHAVHLLDALETRANGGDGVVVVLHDLDLAARYADNILLVCEGQLAAEGSPADVLTSQRLSAAYRTPIHVEQHERLQRLVVIG
jgi:iron complex transport system ATP-binding protein